jgi:hypothetical protein
VCNGDIWKRGLLYQLCLLLVCVDLFKSRLDSRLFYELSYNLTWVSPIYDSQSFSSVERFKCGNRGLLFL